MSCCLVVNFLSKPYSHYHCSPSDVMQDKLEEELGHVEVELDGRFSSVRTRETNLGSYEDDPCTVSPRARNDNALRDLSS